MILVTGGAYCGKSSFIKKQFGTLDNFVVISNFEKYIENLLRKNCDFNEKIEELLYNIKNSNVKNYLVDDDKINIDNLTVIIEIREVGAGIVPVDEFQRKYREAVGRISCVIAENADEVYRVVCGAGMRVK